jgi:hypothetical protein
MITEVWRHRGQFHFNLNEKFETIRDQKLETELEELVKDMLTLPNHKFGNLRTAIFEMKNAKTAASKKNGLEKLFIALNREDEKSTKNTREIRNWILASKAFNDPQKDKIIEELKEILRIRALPISEGRDLKIRNTERLVAGYRGFNEILIGGQREFWNKVTEDLEDTSLVINNGEKLVITEDQKLLGKIMMLQTLKTPTLEERLEALMEIDSTPGSLSDIMRKYRQQKDVLNVCGFENRENEICLNVTNGGPCTGPHFHNYR